MNDEVKIRLSAATRRWTEPGVVSILSGKGGVGKSVIAFNLAERLAASDAKVLLVDADFNCGNLHVLANTGADVGLIEFLSGTHSLERSIVSLSPAFDLLPSPNPPDDTTELSVPAARRMLERLRAEGMSYDVIIIDHASGVSPFATMSAGVSDLTLVVAVPELTSIHDAFGLCKYLWNNHTDAISRLLVNRVHSAEEAAFTAERFSEIAQRFLGRRLRSVTPLPNDGVMRRAVASQCAAARIDAASPVVAALGALSRDVMTTLFDGRREATTSPVSRINIEPASAEIRE